jgi:hypothetical protein
MNGDNEWLLCDDHAIQLSVKHKRLWHYTEQSEQIQAEGGSFSGFRHALRRISKRNLALTFRQFTPDDRWIVRTPHKLQVDAALLLLQHVKKFIAGNTSLHQGKDNCTDSSVINPNREHCLGDGILYTMTYLKLERQALNERQINSLKIEENYGISWIRSHAESEVN